MSLFYIVHHFVKMHRGGKVELHTFLALTLDRGEWPASRSDGLSVETDFPIHIGLVREPV